MQPDQNPLSSHQAAVGLVLRRRQRVAQKLVRCAHCTSATHAAARRAPTSVFERRRLAQQLVRVVADLRPLRQVVKRVAPTPRALR